MEKTNCILYILANKNFQDEEYFETKKIFESNGYTTKAASSIIGEACGKLGGITKLEYLFSEVDALEYDAIVFIGGTGCISLWDDWRSQGLAKLFLDNGKLVAGIGGGVVIMANSGILENINATCDKDYESHVRHGNAILVDENIVVSSRVITASSSNYAREFANTIIEQLK